MTETEIDSTTTYRPPANQSVTSNSITPAPKSHKLLMIGLVILLVLTAGLAAFVISENRSLKSQLGSPQTCEYQGQIYQVGEGFPSTDGCNSCACDTNGLVACTDTACELETETINQTIETVPENLLSYYSFTLPPDFSLEHAKTGITGNDELYFSSKYESLNIILEQTWRNGFGCNVQEKSEKIQVDGRVLTKETWVGIPADYPDENATALCDKNGSIGFRGIIIKLVEPTDQKWGHNLIVTHNTQDISSVRVDQLLDQILSTFKFSNQIDSAPLTVIPDQSGRFNLDSSRLGFKTSFNGQDVIATNCQGGGEGYEFWVYSSDADTRAGVCSYEGPSGILISDFDNASQIECWPNDEMYALQQSQKIVNNNSVTYCQSTLRNPTQDIQDNPNPELLTSAYIINPLDNSAIAVRMTDPKLQPIFDQILTNFEFTN